MFIKKEEKEVKIIKGKVWCSSSSEPYDYLIEVGGKFFCLHCVLAGYCDEELGFKKEEK